MKKNKKQSKGFTLIELLAVIVLLITISAIAIPSITASIERSKAKQNLAKYEIIEAAAESYYIDHKNILSSKGFKDGNCNIPISVLGLTDQEKTDAYGDSMNGGVVYKTEDNSFVYMEEPIPANSCF